MGRMANTARKPNAGQAPSGKGKKKASAGDDDGEEEVEPFVEEPPQKGNDPVAEEAVLSRQVQEVLQGVDTASETLKSILAKCADAGVTPESSGLNKTNFKKLVKAEVEKWMSQRKAAEAESLVSHPLSSPTPAAPAPAAARVPHAQRSAARVLLDDPTYTEEDVRLLDDPTYTEEDVRPTSARVNAGAVQAHAAPSVPSQQSRHAPPVVMWQPLLAPVAGGVQGPLLLTEEMLFNIPGISRPGADAAPAASAEPTASDEIAQQTTAEPRKRAREAEADDEAEGAAAKKATTAAAGEGGEDGEAVTRHEHECPTWLVGRLIGRGSENLKKIQQGSGLQHIEVAKGMPSSKTRTLVLVGSTGAVAKAVSVLEHQIRTLEDQIDSAAEGGQTKQKITCPQMRIAVIIGKRGVTINAIQFVSGAKVQVAQQQPGSAFTDVNITGMEDEVATAVGAVTALIDMESTPGHEYAEQIVAAAQEKRQWLHTAARIDAQQPEERPARDTGGWKEAVVSHPDGSKMVYYINAGTGQSVWERPVEMGWA